MVRVYTGYTEVGYSPPITLWTLGDALSKWYQIYSKVSLHPGEARFQILIRSRQK